ncbi:CDP-alcohol phosphatidyltransferase [Actinokineospora alba]|uniref:CDP-alcohol phosphatidyltransferase n=1 Tax=Actinokineospora alba TaxID=504798 RepID=A0A1H0NE28_9PSEU|nr:CDP-alcohol phosphatidyltransferase family protein [Actinokineospora alba]TDP68688.1 CDP-alcohol phosphatidyltransferase-like enzyme [Actinokineospora alba]SDH84570.1 CDP-alcohol phosphatidyltransferase [Actinokineospora alba]SDO90974.1 CDP-alcohol phosphatidyltransferase [Actinokineospora alba]
MVTLQHTTAWREPAVWAGGQLLLLGVLWATVGLGPLGAVAGLVHACATGVLLTRAMRRSATAALGPADRVTLARQLLIGGVTALVADRADGTVPVVVALAAVALALDCVDGLVARRTGTESPLGARFDMEVDAFLILVLSVHVAWSLGPWVLAIGAARYLFVAASWRLTWLRGDLPPSFARKAVAAAQGITLVVAASGVVPYSAVLVGLALVTLGWSFGRDIVGLWRRARS